MKYSPKRTSGFTLIELLVVISIIAILSVLAVANFSEAGKKARDGKRKADIEVIRQGLVMRRSDVGTYPGDGIAAAATALSGYVSNPFPTDPKAASTPYAYDQTGVSPNFGFCICADLELDQGNATSIACSGIGTTTIGGFYCAQNP